MKHPADDLYETDLEDEDDDLVGLFRAREAALPAVALDVAAVHARATELRVEARRTWAARTASRVATAFRDRNGAWLSSIGGLAAAACFFLSLGVHESAFAPSDEREAAVGFCPETVEPRAAPGNLLSVASFSRAARETTMSTDVGVSDARIVTCTLFGP